MKRSFLNSPPLLIGIFTLTWEVMERVATAAGVTVYQVVWTRYAIHLAFLAIVFGPRHGLGLVRSSLLPQQIFRSLLMLGMPLCFIWGVQRMPFQDLLGVFWTAPILVIVIATMTGDHSGGMLTLAAAVIGFIGALLICKPGAGVFHPAALLALGMAACLAAYPIVSRGMRHEPELVKLFHTALWVFIPLSCVMPFFWQTPTMRGFMAMSAVGVLGCGGLYALDRSVEIAPPALIAPVLYTQLAWDVLLRWVGHATLPDTKTLIGTLLVFAAAIPAFFWRARHAVPSSPPAPGQIHGASA
jgi:drug/metabolite transporter (DMT)-like permease